MMNVGELYIVGIGLAFAGIFVTGRGLARTAGTRNAFLLTAHKVLALAAAALLAIVAARASEAARFRSDDWASVLVAGALLVTAVGSGGFIAGRKTPGRGARVFHRAGSVLAAGGVAVAFYYLLVGM